MYKLHYEKVFRVFVSLLKTRRPKTDIHVTQAAFVLFVPRKPEKKAPLIWQLASSRLYAGKSRRGCLPPNRLLALAGRWRKLDLFLPISRHFLMLISQATLPAGYREYKVGRLQAPLRNCEQPLRKQLPFCFCCRTKGVGASNKTEVEQKNFGNTPQDFVGSLLLSTFFSRLGEGAGWRRREWKVRERSP